MELIPKHKTKVELNGIDNINIDEWLLPYKSNVTKEFKERYKNIIELYQELMEELKWNDIIYNIKLNFQPVIGNTYYLYHNEDNNEYLLSIIAPWEWNKEGLGSFVLDHNGKWNKID